MNADNKKKWSTADRKILPAKALLLAAVVVVFVILLYPSLVIQPHRYQLGEIAERDVKASQDFFVEDQLATEASRRQAVDRVLTVYDFDPRISQNLSSRVQQAFGRMRSVLNQSNSTPDLDTARSEAHERSATDTDPAAEPENVLWKHKEDFETIIDLDVSAGAYAILIEEAFSREIADLIVQILDGILDNGVVANKEVLLKESDRGISLRNVATQTERAVYSLRQYYGPDQARTMVRIVAQPMVKDLDYNLINLIVDFAQRLLHPNITLNRNETEKRKSAALEGIKPVMYQIKAGEMLLREGERVNNIQLLKLKAQEEQKENRTIATTGLGAAIILAALIAVIHLLYSKDRRHKRLDQHRNLLFMAAVLIMVFVLVKMVTSFPNPLFHSAAFTISPASMVYAVPAAVGPMLVCLFVGFEIALPFSLVAAVCAALLSGHRFELFIFFLINMTMGAYWVQHCRERKRIITAGVKLGGLNILLAGAVGIYSSELAGGKLLADALMAFCGGVLSGIITIGTAPLAEMIFQYTSDSTLLELANLDRPILRRLMLEAPGTYHHSVIVGSLVEAAANDIGANPLLAKVCGYYHDIGKVKKPLYFIENQSDGRNKHDKLAPSMSALILIAHIKDGVEIARRNKLGQNIIDTIQQHHGTSLISFFFEKAKQIKGPDAVKINDFRYPGPRPQTKEAGLVMLADICEAASRTLDNPTPARLQGLVQHLINKVFSDGQLDNCELTLKDLHSIAKQFNQILTGIHHHRVEYADPTAKEDIKNRNGSPDRQSAVRPSHHDRDRAKEGPSRLRRLGQS